MAEAGFKFNFGGGDPAHPSGSGGGAPSAADAPPPPPAAPAGDAPPPPPVAEAEEVTPPPAPPVPLEGTDVLDLGAGVSLLRARISSRVAAERLGLAALAESDLQPGVYEGGLKLWEGAADLCRHMVTTYGIDAPALAGAGCEALRGKRVLELGCGHGLPGVLALLAGAGCAHFQDYNACVLSALTAANVGLNLAQNQATAGQEAGGGGGPRRRGGVRYFAGDWGRVCEHLVSAGLGGHYDLVLSAETVYAAPAAARLLECIKAVLQPPHGVALIAAKAYYFGVGGGSAAFQEMVRADGVMTVEVVASVDDGGMRRDVLRLKWPECILPYFL